MSRRLLLKVGKSRRQDLLQEIKRAGCGLPVRELSSRMGMSYMGTKEICLDLERSGYLSTWRNPRPRGRPELLYRLTRKAEELFPRPDNSHLLGLLSAAKSLFGPMAPAKLLLVFFQQQAEEGSAKIRGASVGERMKWIARWRDHKGHYCSLEPGPPPCLVEHHQPLLDVFEAYPDAWKMEEQMLSSLLGQPLRREENPLDGNRTWRFIPAT